MPLARIDAKHYRWHSEIWQVGSLILDRVGTITIHKMPDGISRNPVHWDELILARTGEWTQLRINIRGVTAGLEAGGYDDEEPELYSQESLRTEIGAVKKFQAEDENKGEHDSGASSSSSSAQPAYR